MEGLNTYPTLKQLKEYLMTSIPTIFDYFKINMIYALHEDDVTGKNVIVFLSDNERVAYTHELSIEQIKFNNLTEYMEKLIVVKMLITVNNNRLLTEDELEDTCISSLFLDKFSYEVKGHYLYRVDGMRKKGISEIEFTIKEITKS
ncbi:hypothetical protein Ccar_16270 [Clostridium carboxidivorans P7]|uniref:Uncharacterized protein n=1 Tax=Clostridium carboxidivorans P7 TaxID=536227 RepID=C6PT12_9CLOT|nr:hypothetical protein [Clostridium carboxidivorans]AKN32333.1 hypothetical protein Ccar_16270 [Clostridium carboxidivorans P7]EET87647.1 hypothetical protein CcarbDRAFT_1929 [Clostridium carboxidivorans P7]